MTGTVYVPAILGDFFESLDDYGERGAIRGSPYMFQIWLVEHLRQNRYVGRIQYTVNVVESHRRRGYKERPQRDTTEWLTNLPNRAVEWHLSYWPVRLHLLHTYGHYIISFMSFTNRIFYCPLLIFRQYGLNQGIPTFSGRFLGVIRLTPTL